MNGCTHQHTCPDCRNKYWAVWNCSNPECMTLEYAVCHVCYSRAAKAFRGIVELHKQKVPERTYSASYAKGTPPDQSEAVDVMEIE